MALNCGPAFVVFFPVVVVITSKLFNRFNCSYKGKLASYIIEDGDSSVVLSKLQDFTQPNI